MASFGLLCGRIHTLNAHAQCNLCLTVPLGSTKLAIASWRKRIESMEIPSFRVYRVQINRVILFCFVMLPIVMCKGGKFLKKLWCCVGEEYYKINFIWFYQLG